MNKTSGINPCITSTTRNGHKMTGENGEGKIIQNRSICRKCWTMTKDSYEEEKEELKNDDIRPAHCLLPPHRADTYEKSLHNVTNYAPWTVVVKRGFQSESGLFYSSLSQEQQTVSKRGSV